MPFLWEGKPFPVEGRSFSRYNMTLLTYIELDAIANAIKQGQKEVEISASLGKWPPKLARIDARFVQIDGETFEFSRVKYDQKSVYRLEEGTLKKVQFFSEDTNKFYKLIPTAPLSTLSISGVNMHRFVAGGPTSDNQRRIRYLHPLADCRVLDTCMGLGYTTIEAAKRCKLVVVFEIDPNVIRLARINPYSWEVFHQDNIHLTIGDVYQGIEDLENASFDRVIHDPPRFSLAGNLYSAHFYEQLYRVLRPRGILFHYTGAPGSKKRGRDFCGEVIKRLKAVGFRSVSRVPEVLGVVARRQ